MYSRSPGTAVIHTTLASPSVCTHDVSMASSVLVCGICRLHWVLLEVGSCEKSMQNQSHLKGMEVRATGRKSFCILHIWGRFLWYRDEYSCLPKKRDVASVQRLLKKPREDWCQGVAALLKNSTSDLVQVCP